MRFTTIWTIRGMALKERFRRTDEWLNREIAARLPKKIRYWTTLQMISKVSQQYPTTPIPELTVDKILQGIEK